MAARFVPLPATGVRVVQRAAGYFVSMILLGVALVVAAVILMVLGVAVVAVKWLLWLGIALLVVGGVLLLVHVLAGRRNTTL